MAEVKEIMAVPR